MNKMDDEEDKMEHASLTKIFLLRTCIHCRTNLKLFNDFCVCNECYSIIINDTTTSRRNRRKKVNVCNYFISFKYVSIGLNLVTK